MTEKTNRKVFVRAGEPTGLLGSDEKRSFREDTAFILLPDERWGNPVFGDACLDDSDFHVHARLTLDRVIGTGASMLLGGHYHYSHSRPEGNHGFRISLDEDIIPEARQIFEKQMHIVYGKTNPAKHWNLTDSMNEKAVVGVSSDFFRPGEPFTIDLSRQGPTLTFAIAGREVFRLRLREGGMIPVGRYGDPGWPFNVGFLPGRGTVRIHEFWAEGTLPEPIFPTSDAWQFNSGGYTHYRIPSLCMAPSGRLLAFAEARRARLSRAWEWETVRLLGEYAKDEVQCQMKYSDDNGLSWSEPQTLIDRGMSYDARDPSPVFDRETGELFLFTRGGPWMIASCDEGRTWSEPRSLAGSAPGGFPLLSPGTANSAIQLRHGRCKGRLLVALAGGGIVGLMFSDDHGRTWQPGASAAWSSASEPTLVELADGQVLMSPRGGNSPKDERMFVFSSDGGATFSEIRFEPAIPMPGRGGELLALESSDSAADGKVRPIIFCGPAQGGTRLTLKVSLDDGATWPISRVLDEGKAGNMSLVELPGRQLGILYERDKFRRLSFMRCDLDSVMNDKQTVWEDENE